MGTVPRLLCLVALCVPACAPTYDHRYLYTPRPADVEIQVLPESFVQVAASLEGARREKPNEDLVSLQVKLENLPERAVRLRPGSLALFALVSGDAKVVPQPGAVAPGPGDPSRSDIAAAAAPANAAARPQPAVEPAAGDQRSWSIQVLDTYPLKTLKALASVIGLRPGKGEELPSIEIRLWVENTSDATIRLNPSNFALLAADLRQFPSVDSSPPGTVEIKPGHEARINALFRFPTRRYPGDFDLSSINFRWTVDVGGRSIAKSVTFERASEYYTYVFANRYY